MITGFNTDVKFNGITYHVQTEDKGLATPLILSLVYQHGTILASKRASYESLVGDGFDKAVLEEKLRRQHQLMCAAVQSGRIEDLKRMTRENAAAGKALKLKPEDDPLELAEPKTATVVDPNNREIPSPGILKQVRGGEGYTAPADKDSESADAQENAETVWDIPLIDGVEILEEDDFFDDGFTLSQDAIKVVDVFEAAEVHIEDELKIKFLADYTFRAGEKKNVNLLVCKGPKEQEVADASVMIKILGSAFRPLIFHAKTDKHGVATVFVKLPMFRSGRAAILIRAGSDGEETELRRVVHHQ